MAEIGQEDCRPFPPIEQVPSPIPDVETGDPDIIRTVPQPKED